MPEYYKVLARKGEELWSPAMIVEIPRLAKRYKKVTLGRSFVFEGDNDIKTFIDNHEIHLAIRGFDSIEVWKVKPIKNKIMRPSLIVDTSSADSDLHNIDIFWKSGLYDEMLTGVYVVRVKSMAYSFRLYRPYPTAVVATNGIVLEEKVREVQLQ